MHSIVFEGFLNEMEKIAYGQHAVKLIREGAKAAKAIKVAPRASRNAQKAFFGKTLAVRKALSGTHAQRLRKKFIDVT